jgi:cyclin-dependent kinase regulatory subunit CKS1
MQKLKFQKSLFKVFLFSMLRGLRCSVQLYNASQSFRGSKVKLFQTERIDVSPLSLPIPSLCLSPCNSHVILPAKVARLVPEDRLMTETEWRNIGVTQSRGWIHYMIHRPGAPPPPALPKKKWPFAISFLTASPSLPLSSRSPLYTSYVEPHILLFRRKLTPNA